MSDHTESNGEAPVEAQEAVYDIPAPPTPEDAERAANARPCMTAFLVVIEPDGTAWATSDCNVDLALNRPASVQDFARGCGDVLRDVEHSMLAERTVNMMLQATQQMAEVQRQNKIATKLMQKGIHVPGR